MFYMATIRSYQQVIKLNQSVVNTSLLLILVSCHGSKYGMFPHPTSCAKFVHCSHGIPFIKVCRAPLYFNPKLNVCDWPRNVRCHMGQQSNYDHLEIIKYQKKTFQETKNYNIYVKKRDKLERRSKSHDFKPNREFYVVALYLIAAYDVITKNLFRNIRIRIKNISTLYFDKS